MLLNNPATAVMESEKLSTSAKQCKKIAGDIHAIIEELPAVWEGVSANIFAQNNRQLMETLLGIGRDLEQISADIKTIAAL